ncbi:uncharacterized protein BJ171DRAFT_595791 [Polychytrium aggregatum]|uniref:uncharacterized protein n=1 Tax=Polychytrium aggregatum TaxID=110093 RepID=UPI0022FEA2C5|nr:uncharacterized protein BJ171DRAFT_595791 [Polychytrium aggregatum]KAI9208678.1 hypothetical protein BJ171DRAFT_595791 [Polychytrium aggregatum]
MASIISSALQFVHECREFLNVFLYDSGTEAFELYPTHGAVIVALLVIPLIINIYVAYWFSIKYPPLPPLDPAGPYGPRSPYRPRSDNSSPSSQPAATPEKSKKLKKTE